MKKIIQITGFLTLLLPLVSVSQQVSITPVQFPNKLQRANKVDIAQDNKGQIWIATDNAGLLKYDGEQFTVYKSEDNNNISASGYRMECLITDKKGNIWIGNYEEGLDRFDPETEIFTHYRRNSTESSSLGCDSVKTLMEDSDGIIWIGTKLGLDKLNPETGEFTHIIGDSGDGLLIDRKDVREIYQDSKGAIWIGCVGTNNVDTIKGGLFKLDKTTGNITSYYHRENDEKSLIDNRVRAIFEDSRGVFWVGSSGDGLHIMDRDKGTFQRYPFDPKNPHKLSRPAISFKYHSADHISFINEDAEGQIWIGTFSAGLNRYNPVTDSIAHFGTKEEGPYKTESDDYFSCIKTKDNILWMTDFYPGRNNQTLYKVSTSYNKPNYVNLRKSVYSFAQTTDGLFWFGTNRGLVRKNVDNSFDTLFISANKSATANIINSLEPDNKNNLWVATSGGLFYFNTKTGIAKEYKYYDILTNLPPADIVTYGTYLLDDGTIAVGGRPGFFIMDIKSGNIQLYNQDKGKPYDSSIGRIRNILKDKSGNYWIGSIDGLFRFDKTTNEFHNVLNQQINIRSLFVDSNNLLWISDINSHLYTYNSQTVSISPFNDLGNILSNAGGIGGIIEDNEKLLWFMTRSGIIRLNPETKEAELFGSTRGLNVDEFTGAILKSSNGEIHIGEQNGYYHFYPKELNTSNGFAPEPFISKFFLGDKQLLAGDGLKESLTQTREITLSHDENNFTIEFENMDFLTHPAEKVLLYKLEHFDELWRNKNQTGKAYYFNIPPGKYVFHVKASNMYGNWGEKTLSIIITPPWYNTWWAYSLFALLFLLTIFFIHRFQKARVIKAEREKTREKELEQAREIEKAYTELKATQSQLIQSEKMASLGELTAGIAHEIQNPLNFVNNFSEVNTELIDELDEEAIKGNLEEVRAIAKDIKENEQKINHHGKRADAIVKGMLQHSRTSSGVKEPTDINALADEYLRLSYHGLRAKDKSFNADFKLEADKSLPKINVIPQDIGRVLLNLINNAFYVVNEKAKQNIDGYKPEVYVSTSSSKSPSGDLGVKLVVKDNGPGIPAHIINKIFQPFFTTKPTGQGTGLGLSLSYDIIKAHGGEITVESKKSEGSTFSIQLPKQTAQ